MNFARPTPRRRGVLGKWTRCAHSQFHQQRSSSVRRIFNRSNLLCRRAREARVCGLSAQGHLACYGDDDDGETTAIPAPPVDQFTTLVTGFEAGDSLTCTVSPHDGFEYGAPASTTVGTCGGNCEPIVSNVTILDPIVAGDSLTCLYGLTAMAMQTVLYLLVQERHLLCSTHRNRNGLYWIKLR